MSALPQSHDSDEVSLPDHLLNEPDYCQAHGRELPCWECRVDIADTYADWVVSDRDERESNP